MQINHFLTLALCKIKLAFANQRSQRYLFTTKLMSIIKSQKKTKQKTDLHHISETSAMKW